MNNNTGTMINTPEGIQMYHLLSQKYALKLELIGMRHSRGSVYAHIKRTYGLKGNKQKVYDQFSAMIDELKASK